MKIAIFLQVQCTDQGTSPKFEFFKNNHKIDFAKKLFNYENTGRKKEAVKNIRKSETIVSLPTCACSNAS